MAGPINREMVPTFNTVPSRLLMHARFERGDVAWRFIFGGPSSK